MNIVYIQPCFIFYYKAVSPKGGAKNEKIRSYVYRSP